MPTLRLHRTTGVRVGHVQVGGGAPVVVQSMTSTDTTDVEATVTQCLALAEAGEGAERRELTHQRAVADIVTAALAKEGAQVDGLECGDIGKRGGAAEMFGQERVELAEIAGISLERLRREAPLGREVRKPVAPEGFEIGHAGSMALLP